MKTAILQVADTGPLDSLVHMLEFAGYDCYLPNSQLYDELAALGCDTLVRVESLVRNWGYEMPLLQREAPPSLMEKCDLFVDIKAHRNAERVWKRWPHLRNRTLWYRINGGKPEHVVNFRGDMGDEANPPCPILTPNLWYGLDEIPCPNCRGEVLIENKSAWMSGFAPRGCPGCEGWGRVAAPWKNKAYAFWPPFVKFHEYQIPREPRRFTAPLCLVHNFKGWGYSLVGDLCRERLGLQILGRGSPDGLIDHKEIPVRLSNTLAYVHLKSCDAPGYALYEALAAACPLIVPRRLIWRNRMQDLFEADKTCLVFDRETHDSLTPETAWACFSEIEEGLRRISNPEESKHIGEAGRARLQQLMWNRERDGAGLLEFMKRFQ